MSEPTDLEQAAPRPPAKRLAHFIQRLFIDLGVLPFLLLLAMIVFTAISENFLSVQNLTNVVRQSVYLIIVSLGQMLALLTGGFDLSVGTIVALTSVVGAMAMAAVFAAHHDAVALSIAAGATDGIAAGV